MDFVNLDRLFAPLKNDAEATLDFGAYWGRKYGGWHDWDDLLKRRRVALLAEALCGKTQELQFRAEMLQRQGKHAFFVRIEDLADGDFEGALDEIAVAAFETWKNEESTDAWFFLDSVDEARLNGKKLTVALRNFRKELKLENLGRAYVVVTCRVSDWRGKADRDAFEQELPYPTVPDVAAGVKEPDEVLLAPIFNQSEKIHHDPRRPSEPHPAALLVVQLAPLNDDQKRKLANAAGISSVQTFLDAVDISGLQAMTERPGDLIDLLGYWKDHGAFGTLAQMTEEGIKRKLREEDAFRPDAAVLAIDQVRCGAERLAAALVLAKTFTIKAPGQEPDLSLTSGAVEPSDVLPEWSQAEINALLRKGLFAPATYGRVRFHHRSSQEYLAACWLQRLISTNCPLEEVRRLLFVELYGVQTVVPTLRAVAAWLSLWQPSIRDEVIRREPVSLIIHGDPKSLPLEVREALLSSYAALDVKGQLNVDMIDYRAVWMFSDAALGEAVRRAWGANSRHEFRLQLLRFIEEAPIRSCADLARATALDTGQSQYARMVAARVMSICDDTSGLEVLARKVRAEPDRLSARLAPELALVLFPNYLTASDLIDLIDRSAPARPYQTEGFAKYLDILHGKAPHRAAQKQLAFGIAALCLSTPHIDAESDVSRKHVYLSKGLADLALAELTVRREGDVEPGLVQLLMATERTPEIHNDAETIARLSQRVRRDKALNRELMWADARIGSSGKVRETAPTHFWQIGPHSGRKLWSIDISDIEWLVEDCRTRPEVHERRVAFSAIHYALRLSDLLAQRQEMLDELASADPILRSDLDGHLTPPEPNEYEAAHQQHLQETHKREEEAKSSWIKFRDELKHNPAILDASESLKSWRAGLYRLHHLTDWVKSSARAGGARGP